MAAADVVLEILLYLPLQPLLRCRAVCKLWRDVIDSSSFRKLHTTTHDDEDDTVYLVLEFLGDDDDLKLSVSMTDINRRKFLSLKHDFNDAMPNSHIKPLLKFTKYVQPISICNPFLGQMRTLPIPHNPCRSFTYPNSTRAAIGFDDDDSSHYKVLQMLYCRKHYGLHARLYSTRTDSWRDLDGDGVVLDRDVRIRKSIISLPCNNGYFVHWKTFYEVGGNLEPMILTLDMKNHRSWIAHVLLDRLAHTKKK